MQYSEKILPGGKQLFYAWFSAMFSRVDLVLFSEESRSDLKDIAQSISNQIEAIESLANRFNPGSELSNLNEKAFGNEVIVSSELYHIISECLEFNKQTSGYFDITVNSLNGFRAGAAAIQLHTERQSIRYMHPDLLIDLSGFIKGYALRSVREKIVKAGINHALVSLGNSSVMAIGNHPFGRGWKVSHPDAVSLEGCVLLNQCMTTSGNKAEAKWPVIHPVSGEAVEIKPAVSVITDDPAIGEVLSTALYVAESDEKIVLLERFCAVEVKW
jgi:FAD:protein FMN transferase